MRNYVERSCCCSLQNYEQHWDDALRNMLTRALLNLFWFQWRLQGLCMEKQEWQVVDLVRDSQSDAKDLGGRICIAAREGKVERDFHAHLLGFH